MRVFHDILRALEANNVRYVLVGGVAVVLHGFARFTKDLDLVVDLHPEEARRAIQTLLDCGLRPHLIELKKSVARPQDLIDVEQLTRLKKAGDEH